ncbi:chromate transporter [Isoptericola jiangsuensis]|uniref:Chromate transporter n=1 Tax=Isoptericola jiangsuensis TaxID=548579 RepID=A0A2A9ERL8_9MICO|nr:chromate efflux transporter [Isoptericola jiangsuensis]PFG41518.1 chromate transporter [Isoptericola jiangsuensis]
MTDATPARPGTAGEVFRAFLRLGLTSFGGPVAHLGYFRDDLVARRRWVDDRAYGELVALGQFLPGPASSQVGFALGLTRAGWAGALAAWFAFTVPSAVLMVAFASGTSVLGTTVGAGVVAGLKVVAVAVVAHAVQGMARSLTPDAPRAGIAVGAALLVLLVGGPVAQVGAVAAGVAAGLLWCRTAEQVAPAGLRSGVSRRTGAAALVLFAVLLAALPVAAAVTGGRLLDVVDGAFRSGALVFGGGHVVLPLLEAEAVGGGWVTPEQFLAGYGAAQALPGPLFAFAAYLGALALPGSALLGAAAALVAVFLPGFLLLVGVLPFWDAVRARPSAQAALRGANAAVVGVLAAALYDPVFVTAVTGPATFGLALVCFVALTAWRVPPWGVVLVGAAGGVLLALL